MSAVGTVKNTSLTIAIIDPIHYTTSMNEQGGMISLFYLQIAILMRPILPNIIVIELMTDRRETDSVTCLRDHDLLD